MRSSTWATFWWPKFLPAIVELVQVIRGFGFGSYTTSAMTFAAETGVRRTRGSNSGIFFMASSAGQLAGMFLGGAVVQAVGFYFMFAMCSTFAFCSGICFLLLRTRTRRAGEISAAA
ncbi:MAG: MFS transporter [Caldilineaceae bacterium]|nr:MFS transporter [Caldilineaceae bacterium]